LITFAEVRIGTGPTTPCLKCAARSTEPSMRDAAAVLAELAEVAAAWRNAPGPNVALGGVEPFSHPELPAIVQGAVESGYERVRLDTDAGALALGGNAAGVIAAGVRHLEVVLLAEGSEHDTLCGRPGLYAAAVAGVAAFRSAAAAEGAHVCVTGRVPVCRHNLAHVCRTVPGFAAMGAVAVRLDPIEGPLDIAIAREMEQAAMMQGIWLHALGHAAFPAPVATSEVRS